MFFLCFDFEIMQVINSAPGGKTLQHVLQIGDFRKATITQLLDKMEPNKQTWSEHFIFHKILTKLQHWQKFWDKSCLHLVMYLIHRQYKLGLNTLFFPANFLQSWAVWKNERHCLGWDSMLSHNKNCSKAATNT